MQRFVFILMIFLFSLHAEELLIITNRNFPLQQIQIHQLRALYLGKKHLIGQTPVLPINYSTDNPLRHCFERQILRKSRYALKRYWLKAHYNGKRPPKVVKSTKALFAYLKEVPGAIGYVKEHTTLTPDIKILSKIACE